MSGVRCFVGVPLPACVADPLVDACTALRARDLSWDSEKWVARENLHLTVKFIGSIAQDELQPLLDAMEGALREREAFVLPFAGIRAVPSPRRARMLWADFLDPDAACADLAAAVEHAVAPWGIQPEERDFRPHATLCRARKAKPVAAVALEASAEALNRVPEFMSVPSVSLFSSRLTPRGPIYTEIGAWRLRGD